MPAATALPLLALPLAQSGSSAAVGVLPWIVALIVAVVVGGYIIMTLRRRLLSDRPDATAGGLFQDLEAMHRRGELSDEELARAKRAVTERILGEQDALKARRAQRPAR